jgi:hypothetical protein
VSGGRSIFGRPIFFTLRLRRSPADTRLIAIAFASGAFTRHIARRPANDTLMTLYRQPRHTTVPLDGRLEIAMFDRSRTRWWPAAR